MTNLRRTLALVASLTVAGLMVAGTPGPASARTADERCLGRGPIAASSLGPGAAAPGCSLVGRMVTDGHVSVVVPPAGTSVAGEGVGRHGETRSLQVTNTGTTVRAVVGAASRGTHPSTRVTRAAGACRDRTFHLEGHRWRSSLRFRVNLHRMPRRYRGRTVIAQIRAANGNMR